MNMSPARHGIVQHRMHGVAGAGAASMGWPPWPTFLKYHPPTAVTKYCAGATF
jgi:hypothetical protein